MSKKDKINHQHIAKIRKAYIDREEKRHHQTPPFENLVSDFVSMVSHELRTPLTIIREGMSLINEGELGPTTAKQNQALGMSLGSIDRLIRLVNELLDISRLEKGRLKLHKRLFNLSHLTEEIFKNFESIVRNDGKALSYELMSHSKKLLVYADRDKLTQVLMNVIENALKNTEEGNSIKMRVGEDGENAYISVLDTGIGIPKKELPLVFKKFHQVKRAREEGKGLGLGLSIAEQIIKLHGGKIYVRSKEGKGAEFIIKLVLPIPFLTSIIKLIRRESLTKEEIKDIQSYGLVKLLIEAIEYPGLDIDEKEELLEAIQEMKLHKGILPCIWDHIEDFRKIDLKDKNGRHLSAANYKEAFLMAYIEKNMGEFKYRGKPIYKYGDTEGKRLALMSLVKEFSPEQLNQKLRGIEE